jgi:hypothetical protein
VQTLKRRRSGATPGGGAAVRTLGGRAAVRTLGRAASVGVLVWGLSEGVHFVASRLQFPPRPAGSGAPSVVILGFPCRDDGSPSWLQRWRAAIAVRSVPPQHRHSARYVPTGWSRGRSEAARLATLLRQAGVSPEQIVLEERATTTRENLLFAVPLTDPDAPLIIASDPLHALRARRYLRHSDPSAAARLTPGADYRFAEYWWTRPPMAAFGLLTGVLAGARDVREQKTTTPSTAQAG